MIREPTIIRAARSLQQALAIAGACCMPVYRVPADANGVATGPAACIGCLYGVRYERGQIANVLIDIPGIVLRRDTPRLLCSVTGCARELRAGDVLCYRGQWYEALSCEIQMGITLDIVIKEGARPDGV